MMLTDHRKVVCTHPVDRKNIGYKKPHELLEISEGDIMYISGEF